MRSKIILHSRLSCSSTEHVLDMLRDGKYFLEEINERNWEYSLAQNIMNSVLDVLSLR